MFLRRLTTDYFIAIVTKQLQIVSLRYMKFCLTQGLIFVVDSNDRERATEAREELTKMVF